MVDLAKIGEQVAEKNSNFGREIARVSDFDTSQIANSLKSARESMQGFSEAIDRVGGLSALNAHREVAENFRDAMSRANLHGLSDSIEAARLAASNLNSPDVAQRMASVARAAERGSALANAADRIADQQKSLERSFVSHHEMLRAVENPADETNRRLARIENHFENSAQIANDLQASAAEFIQDFRQAADDTSKTSRIAIWAALVAIVITLGQLLAPFVVPNRETEALRQSIVALTAELENMRYENSSGRVQAIALPTNTSNGPR